MILIPPGAQNAFCGCLMMIMKLLIKIGSQNGKLLQFDYTSVELETKSILMKLLDYYNRITLSFCSYLLDVVYFVCQLHLNFFRRTAFICIEIEQFKNCISTLLISKS